MPSQSTIESAGYDLYTIEDQMLLANQLSDVRTGVAIRAPEGTCGKISLRSSTVRKEVSVRGGLIDRDYTGEIIVMNQKTTSSKKEQELNCLQEN